MMMSKYFRLFFCAIALIVSVNVFAQSSRADKLFLEASQLENKTNKFPKTAAIKKYKEARVAYKGNADKQKACDIAIARCSKRVAPVPSKQDDNKGKGGDEPSVKNKFSVDKQIVVVDAEKGGSESITVTCASSLWSCKVEGVESGKESFVSADKNSDGKSFFVKASPNPTTLQRIQYVNVKHESANKRVKVVQPGIPVVMEVSSSLLNFKPKGGDKTIKLTTNSDSIIVDNSNHSWFVKSKPKWVNVEIGSKNKGLLNKVKDLASSALNGKIEGDDVKITVVPILKSDPEYSTGRMGEIIFQSQDKQCKVTVTQQK